mmetsp:Transcript_2928/g.4970  ORF Transcript_2928/g.4970 Transcript_2928/m.4970 type:complete len:93 (+) Transcript_2928:256-534(+)
MPNLKYVLVSPLRRCLQTAYYLFCEHPNFEKVKFILDPNLREHLHSPCDVGKDIQKSLAEFRELIPNLDTSLLDELVLKSGEDSNLWFLQNL